MTASMVRKAFPSISRCTYHVFLSFRGTDTRKNFTDHLYRALVQAGTHTFKDDQEIERGKNLKDEIEKAILHQSKIFIIVLSKDYASSTWCLDELVKILELRKSSEHTVLPIFYDVDPTQVKKQTGSFAEAFAKHEENFESEMDMVQRWRDALKEVADLGGMVLQDRHESQFIQDIVKEVQNKLHRTALYVPPYLVGIDFLVTCINWWLKEGGSNKVGIATIYGIGGIGKTTIAKVVYNQNIQRFEGCSFLADVREVSQQCNGLVRLQKQLISDLTGKANKIYNSDDGIIKIKEAFCCRRIILVLDDVEDPETITKIIGTQVPFHPGSKILITSRHRSMLSVPFCGQLLGLESPSSYEDVCKEFEVKELAFNESLHLFNWYAFGGQGDAIETSMEYAKKVVKHCGGLPLALKVLGSSLSGKSMSVWNSALEKLEAILDGKIQKILRISYDSLEDEYDKNLFLDIACLFIGMDRDYTTTILNGCDFYTTVGIENLIIKSLLIVNEKNKLMMHQMIRDMGREIIRQESSNPGKRSRLWHKDAFDVIREKNGTKTVKCFSIDLTSLHLVIPFLKSNEVDLETEGFTKMHRLKLLQLDYAKLKGGYRNFSKGLIWLRWHGFPLQHIPTDFDISRIVVLDMRRSNLKHVWKETKCLSNLKILNLNHSHDLLKTPNFSGLLSLEKLMLKDCIKLSEVDQSIGELRTLNFLNLKGCKSLKKLPNTVGKLVSLEELILSGCSRLENVPGEIQNMKSLRVLSLDETALYDSNSCLSWLSLRRRKELNLFWASLPRSLVKLSLENCRLSDNVMPNDLSGLPSLESLNLSRNPIYSLPESINSLTKLKELVLACCKELQSLPKLPITSSGLYVKISQSMNRVSSLNHLLSTRRCIIFGCEKLTMVEGVFKLEPVENFEMEDIKSLFNVDYIRSNEVQIYNYLTDTKIITAPQVIHECGITSCFVLGSEVPMSFEHRSKGSKISFCLPSSTHDPEENISWLCLCIVFSLISDGNIDDFNYMLPCVAIVNETKDIKFTYYSNFIGIPEFNDNKTMIWLIHLPATSFQLEGGDSVRLELNEVYDLIAAYTVATPLDVREIGVSCKSGMDMEFECFFQQSYQGNEDDARNIEMDLTKGLLNLSSSGNVKVQIYNLLKEANTVAFPQVLYDCGIISVVDRSHEILLDSRGLSAVESKISFTVLPPNSGRTISWLQSRIVLSADTDNILARVEIVNETKDTNWTYCKHFIGIPEARNQICWLSSWKFKGELGAGDNASFTLFSDTFVEVEECAIDFIYESNDNLLSGRNSTDWYSHARTRWSHWYFDVFVYYLFIFQRTLHKSQSSYR